MTTPSPPRTYRDNARQANSCHFISASLRRYCDQGQFFGAAGVGQREEENDDRERALGLQVAVINPEPVVAVTHRGEGRGRLILAAMNPHGLERALRGGGVLRRVPPAFVLEMDLRHVH